MFNNRIIAFRKTHFFKIHKEALTFLCMLSRYGETVIFGGFLRNLSLEQTKFFSSDIDIVIKTKEREQVISFLKNYNSIQNKFGGYRILNKTELNYDIWFLEDTWAFRKKIIKYSPDFNTLPLTTFFSMDSILYQTKCNKIIMTDQCAKDLRTKTLDIELEECSNEISAFVRSIYLSNIFNLNIGSKLFYFIKSSVKHVNTDDIINYSIKKYGVHSCFSRRNIEYIFNIIDMKKQYSDLFDKKFMINQLNLPLKN